jgi:NADPH:quinone reductase-like Zn-dependent oxidoreductase
MILYLEVITSDTYYSNCALKSAGTSSFGMSGINAHGLFSSGNNDNLMNDSTKPFLYWNKERCWPVPQAHPLLRKLCFQRTDGNRIMELDCSVDNAAAGFLMHHVVHDKILLPATAFLEILHATCYTFRGNESSKPTLLGVSIISPLIMAAITNSKVSCSFNAAEDLLEITSSTSNRHIAATVGVAISKNKKLGNDSFSNLSVLGKLLLEKSSYSCSYPAKLTSFLACDLVENAATFHAHPALADAALHLGALATPSISLVPVGIQASIACALDAKSSTTSQFAGVAGLPRALPQVQNGYTCDHQLVGADAFAAMCCHGVESKQMHTKTGATKAQSLAAKEFEEMLYNVNWQAFQQSGADSRNLKKLPFAASSQWELDGVFSFYPAELRNCTEFTAANIALLQPSLESRWSAASTSAAASLNKDIMGALVKVAAIEAPDLAFSHTALSELLAETTKQATSLENDAFGEQICGGYVIKPSLLRETTSVLAPLKSHVQLYPELRGSLANLKLNSVKEGVLKPHEIAVNVFAVGLNFRDVLNVLGMYPGDPGPPGGDCAGIVVGTGTDATLKVGQAVYGQAAGSLGSKVIVDESMMTSMPRGVSFEAAASLPTVFLTALACLEGAAATMTGDIVLIHAATGGLGLAAIQIAQSLGAQVVGTAGGVTKRTMLRSSSSTGEGICAALDSRSISFASELYQMNSKQSGVDVVLNSLTSPGMIGASLSTLNQGGRFVEVAKRDIWCAARVAQERPDVCFTTVAVDFMPPSVINRGLVQISTLLVNGKISPPPLVDYSLGDAAHALRHLSAARHVGKIVTSRTYRSRLPSISGSWAIVGGTGALGLLAAKHLLSIGAQECILIGRSGHSKSIGESQSRGGLLSMNAAVRSFMADASCSADLQLELLTERPLQGILHAGGIVRDATILHQNMHSIRATMGPKLDALKSIIKETQFLSIQACNVFSSVAAALGSGGQANYAASNTAIDFVSNSMHRMVRRGEHTFKAFKFLKKFPEAVMRPKYVLITQILIYIYFPL